MQCSKGTYVRSLARDLGVRLGCGAYVETLRRERVGPFTTARAVTLEASAEEAWAQLQPLSAAVAELPRLTLHADEVTRLCHGQRLSRPDVAGTVAVFDDQEALVAVARGEGGFLIPEKVLRLET